MRIFALSMLTLCLVALSQAYGEYNLQCTNKEVGIRWPSYHSSSEYYMCQSVGAIPLKFYCYPGELFTFVMQTCTSPSKFIAPPPLNVLPTSPPMKPIYGSLNGMQTPYDLPKPVQLPGPVVNAPPNLMPSVQDASVPKPPVLQNGLGVPSMQGNQQPIEGNNNVLMPPQPPQPVPTVEQANVPIPPTPAPTPPVVQVTNKKLPPPKRKNPVKITTVKPRLPPKKPSPSKS